MTLSQTPIIVQGTPAPTIRPSSIDKYVSSTDLYPVQRIKFLDLNTRSLLQGRNGPCPLLAISNVLLLKGALTLPEDSVEATFEWLTSQLAGLMRDEMSRLGAEMYEGSSLEDCICVLGSLNKGLQVDVTFLSADGFEDTKEMGVFKNLGVAVYHGWIVSEEDMNAFPHVSRLSYNEAVDKVAHCEELKSRIISGGDFESISEHKDTIEEGEAISNWLSETSSQLTTDGIIQLNARMENGGLAVLFRNNHFSVIHKRNDRLYSLATDVGFRSTGIAWESLDQVDGDSEYFTESFTPILLNAVREAEMTSDYELALRLQFEGMTNSNCSPPRQAAVRPQGVMKKKKNKCTIM